MLFTYTKRVPFTFGQSFDVRGERIPVAYSGVALLIRWEIRAISKFGRLS